MIIYPISEAIENLLASAVDEETGEEKTILFGLTGTGYFDMKAYETFNDGKMQDYIPTDEEIKKAENMFSMF